jgi:hypothetical protein
MLPVLAQPLLALLAAAPAQQARKKSRRDV